jgi:hypothetical protein
MNGTGLQEMSKRLVEECAYLLKKYDELPQAMKLTAGSVLDPLLDFVKMTTRIIFEMAERIEETERKQNAQ